MLEQLRAKYCLPSSLVLPAVNARENERSSSRLKTSDCHDSVASCARSPKITKKPGFRDVVLRAAQFKPFRENLDVKAQRRLSGIGHIARLERFRQIASRWKRKSKKETDIEEILSESDYERAMIPEKPRFCATLSTEAQYAIFKGYEDALVHKILTSLPPSSSSNEEVVLSITRAPSACKAIESDETISPFTILETDKPMIVLVPSESEEYSLENTDELQPRKKGADDHDQRYMTAQFEKAMKLLDELTRNSYIEHTGTEHECGPAQCESVVTLERNIRQYHAWSQQWKKHFEFSC